MRIAQQADLPKNIAADVFGAQACLQLLTRPLNPIVHPAFDQGCANVRFGELSLNGASGINRVEYIFDSDADGARLDGDLDLYVTGFNQSFDGAPGFLMARSNNRIIASRNRRLFSYE